MDKRQPMFDVVVVGAGLVGSTCALALSRQGLKVMLLDRKPPELNTYAEGQWDSRIYAVSPGNVQWLQELGVWAGLDSQRICPVRQMQVWGDEQAALRFDAYEAGLANLSFIVENSALLRSLHAALHYAGVSAQFGVATDKLEFTQDAATLHLQDGQAISAKLLVAADGGQSWVRQQAGLSFTGQSYSQQGLVANFSTERPHQQIARQWFMQDEVMAWLPLSGNAISIVWSTADADALLQLSPQDLEKRVETAGHGTLGALKLITPAVAFPLNMQTAEHLTKSRLVLVGDAAHQVHPMAGQGVNLGFRDVKQLAATLQHRTTYEDIGGEILLRRYERARKLDMLAMRQVTHGLHALFASRHPVVKKIRNWGMQLTNQQATLKKQLIKQAVI